MSTHADVKMSSSIDSMVSTVALWMSSRPEVGALVVTVATSDVVVVNASAHVANARPVSAAPTARKRVARPRVSPGQKRGRLWQVRTGWQRLEDVEIVVRRPVDPPQAAAIV